MAKDVGVQKAVISWMNLERPDLRGQEPGPLIPQDWLKPTQIELREVDGRQYIAWQFDVEAPRVEGKDQEWFCQMLLGFTALGYQAVDPQAIKAFADRYGPLGIEVREGKDLTGEIHAIGRPGWSYESVETWKKYAAIARAVLTLTSYLSTPESRQRAKNQMRLHYTAGSLTCRHCSAVEPHRHYVIGDGSPEFGPRDAWDILLKAGAVAGWAAGGEAEAIGAARYWLAEFVTALLEKCQIRPRLLWWGEACELSLWRYSYVSGQIFGRIGLMMSGVMGIALCSAPGCTALLRVTSQRSIGKNAWCDRHRRTVAVKEAMRRLRNRKRRAADAAEKKGKKKGNR